MPTWKCRNRPKPLKPLTAALAVRPGSGRDRRTNKTNDVKVHNGTRIVAEFDGNKIDIIARKYISVRCRKAIDLKDWAPLWIRRTRIVCSRRRLGPVSVRIRLYNRRFCFLPETQQGYNKRFCAEIFHADPRTRTQYECRYIVRVRVYRVIAYNQHVYVSFAGNIFSSSFVPIHKNNFFFEKTP